MKMVREYISPNGYTAWECEVCKRGYKLEKFAVTCEVKPIRTAGIEKGDNYNYTDWVIGDVVIVTDLSDESDELYAVNRIAKIIGTKQVKHVLRPVFTDNVVYPDQVQLLTEEEIDMVKGREKNSLKKYKEVTKVG